MRDPYKYGNQRIWQQKSIVYFGPLMRSSFLTLVLTAVMMPAVVLVSTGQSSFARYSSQSHPDEEEAIRALLSEPYESFVAHPDEASVAFAQARTTAVRMGNREAEAQLCDRLGVVHFLAGRYDSSVYYTTAAIQLYQSLNKPIDAAKLECGLGHQMKRRNLSEAFKHFSTKKLCP